MSCTGFFQGQIAVFNFWEHRNLLGMCWYSQVYLAGCRYTLRDAPRPVLQELLLGGELVGEEAVLGVTCWLDSPGSGQAQIHCFLTV